MTAQEIQKKVVEVIVEELSVEESEVTREANFTTDLGADSLDTVEIIMALENEFGITIPTEEAKNIKTVGEAVDYVCKEKMAE